MENKEGLEVLSHSPSFPAVLVPETTEKGSTVIDGEEDNMWPAR